MASQKDDASLTDLTDTADELRGSLAEVNKLSRDFTKVLTGGLKSAIAEGRKFDEVMRQLALSFSAKTVDRALSPLQDIFAKGISGGFQGLTAKPAGSPLDLTAFTGGGMPKLFARGGVVSTPAYFPLGGHGVGLAGEAGSEAILPLARGADGRLGVSGPGAGGPVNVTLNVTTSDVESFRRSQGQLTTMLARAVGRGRRGL